MTIKKIQEELKKKYPRIVCIPIYHLGLPTEKDKVMYSIHNYGENKTVKQPEYMTKKEAWVAIYEKLKENK